MNIAQFLLEWTFTKSSPPKFIVSPDTLVYGLEQLLVDSVKVRKNEIVAVA